MPNADDVDDDEDADGAADDAGTATGSDAAGGPAADLTKRDRLVNAWLAAGWDANVATVASLTDASESYASQVRQSMEDDEIDADAIAVPNLVDRYRAAVADETDATERGDPVEASAGSTANETSAGGTANGPGATETRRRGRTGQTDGNPERGQQRPPRRPAAGGVGGPARPTDAGQDAGTDPGRTEPSGGQGSPGTSGGGQPVQQPTPGPTQRGTAHGPQGAPQRLPPAARSIQSGAGQRTIWRPSVADSGLSFDEGLYVPVGRLQEIDATLALYEEAAQFDVQNAPPGQPLRQAALARLFVAEKARELLNEVASDAVPAEEV